MDFEDNSIQLDPLMAYYKKAGLDVSDIKRNYDELPSILFSPVEFNTSLVDHSRFVRRKKRENDMR